MDVKRFIAMMAGLILAGMAFLYWGIDVAKDAMPSLFWR